MPEEGSVTLDTESFKALSSEARVKILQALDTKRMTLSDLSRELDLAKPTLKEHLDKLDSARLVMREDEGRKWIYYSLSRKAKRILHPERTRFKILFSFSMTLIIVATAIMTIEWSVRSETMMECTYCGNPLWDTFVPMMATFLAIFGLIVMVYAYRELKVKTGHRVLAPPEK
ncbi:MAG: winged helix-turn-helix transcriptional regulator [Thermoplasmata archaeon]|nr:winged helix-turn-helix transcriptional regulator [Thermoplasmata archaeon]